MRMTTKQAARGKWNGILSELIGEQAITRKHGPCPICGGEDRYRYDNKRNDGDWFCNVCGPGDGFKLLQESLGIDFAEAAARVDKIVGNVEEEPFREDVDIQKRKSTLNSMWKSANDPSFVAAYLKARGIDADTISKAKDLRGKLQLYHAESKKVYPAMLALIRNSEGVPVSIHRTYLLEMNQRDKKIMPPVESIMGGCVRLFEPEDELILAEGIETALAAYMMTGIPAWATISAGGMEGLKSIPRHVKRVIVCADNDASFTGQAAAFACARYMKLRMHVDTEVWMPPIPGHDLLDQCNFNKENKFEYSLFKWGAK